MGRGASARGGGARLIAGTQMSKILQIVGSGWSLVTGLP